MKKIIFIVLVVLNASLYANNEELSTFTLTDSDGNQIHVQDIKEGLIFEEHKNAVLLLMFGHNCPPCKEEIPQFIELTKKFGDKLTIVALEVQGYKTAEVKKFKEQNKINYILISGDDNYNFLKHIVQRAGWKGRIPFLIAIDKHGAVQFMQPGLIKKEYLEELIEKLNK